MVHAPKYMDIVEWTVEQITSGRFKPKDKFLSEAALGEKFGYSRQTVRRALEVLEQRGHITRIQGSGTYISTDQSHDATPVLFESKSPLTVGLISTYMDNYIFPGIIRGIESVFSTAGIAVELVSTNNQVSGETRALQLMKERQLDGLIVEPTRSALPCANLELYHTIIRSNRPLVFIDSFYPELNTPYVALDDVKAGAVATEHLISMGHRNIMGVFPHSNRQGHLRYLGYVTALTENGIRVEDNLIFWHARENLQQTIQSNPFKECLSKITAVLCYNDSTALSIMGFLRENGRSVPEDISVVGIDNSALAKISSLTSVAHPQEQLGEAAAKLLLSMINGAEGKNILFPPRLFVRDSVRQLGTKT